MKEVSKLVMLLFAINLPAQKDFSKLKWRNRILLLSAQSLSSENYNTQIKLLLSNPKKLDDRNLVIFTLIKGRIYDKEGKLLQNFDVASLRKKYDLGMSYEGMVLIGKDGAAKIKKPFPVEPSLIFGTIDQMPMRKTEMRENIDD